MQTCTEMVIPMTCSKESMFPPSVFDYKEFAEQCQMKHGVLPRPNWITTEFGGEVSFFFRCFSFLNLSIEIFDFREDVDKCLIYYWSELINVSCLCREFRKYWRDLVAISYFPMECRIHGAEEGKLFTFLYFNFFWFIKQIRGSLPVDYISCSFSFLQFSWAKTTINFL